MNESGMVVVGAGEAGVRAALELRSLGWDGEITLIGNEGLLPYERPKLSKELLIAVEEPSPAAVVSEAQLAEERIDWVSGDAVRRIDREGHRVELASGREIPYMRLLLAIGAKPRKLEIAGDGAGDLIYLRRYEDAVRLRESLRNGSRVVVIGGGFIGLEVAASAIQRGCAVTLLEAGRRLLARGVPEAIAKVVEQEHRKQGVRIVTGASLERIDKGAGEFKLRLADGTVIPCDIVIAGIGAVPETALAEKSGLDIDNGIRVNEKLQTSDPNIFAAGDCCSFPHVLFGNHRIRLEAWRNAVDQGMHAAGNMLGSEKPYGVVPWFWSDQYDLTLQVAGLTDRAVTIVERNMGEEGQIYFHLNEEGTVVAVSGIGSGGSLAKHIRIGEMLVEKQAKPAAEALADHAVRLKQLMR
jgi:3-phenylpropionate/trans-cinnamate dioxygenase ferredoxin reductase subunit